MTPIYTATRDTLIQQGIVTADDVYNTDNDPYLSELFDLYHEKMNEHLQGRKALLNFPPSFLYFHNDFSVNGFARTHANYKLIGIYYGSVEILFALFEDSLEKFAGEVYQDLHDLSAKIGNPLNITFFQFFSLFVYYHEYAHLVQRAPQAFYDISEEFGNVLTAGEALEKHKREFDADWFAATNLAMHMTQFFKDADGNFNATPEEVQNIAAIGLASILCYFIKSAGTVPNLYLQEKSHAHRYVRLSYCTFFLLETIAPNLPQDFPVNNPAILTKSVQLASIILEDEMGEVVNTFMGIFLENVDAIEAYIQEIIAVAIDDPFMCRNRPLDQI